MFKTKVMIFYQIAIVLLVSSAFSYISTIWNYKSAFNGVWAFFFPALISIVFNDGKKMQIIMLCILMFISFFVAGFSAVLTGFY
jgi:hypothetical protein